MPWYNPFSLFSPFRTLDVSAKSDVRNNAYPVRSILPPNKEPVSRRWNCYARLDQGSQGACVAFAISHWLASDPNPVKPLPTNDTAFALYADIQKNDRMPGEDYDGTWIEDGLKWLIKQRRVDEFRWCNSVREMAQTISFCGPLICKIPVYEDFYYPTPFFHQIKPRGKIVGWHAILADEIDIEKRRVWFVNSWGKSHGKDGRVWMSFETVDTCIGAGSTAAVAIKKEQIKALTGHS